MAPQKGVGHRFTRTAATFSWMPLVGFYVLACTVSWTCWSVAGAMLPTVSLGAGALDLIGSYGPAIAAMAFAGRTGRVRGGGAAWRAVVAGLVLLVSVWVLWSSWRVALDTGASVGALAGLLAATVLPAVATWFRPRRPSEPAAPGRGEKPSPPAIRPPWTLFGWLVVALLLFPVTSAVGSAMVALLTGSAVTLSGGAAWPADATALVGVFAGTAMYGGPFGEEPGWRAFALPRLQTRLSPLLASVAVGVGWAAWHLPLQLRGAYEQSMGTGLWGVGLRFASQVAVSVIFTWIFNRSKGSLLVVVILHTSLNNTAGYWLADNIGFQVAVGLLAVILVLVGRMDRRSSVSRTDG